MSSHPDSPVPRRLTHPGKGPGNVSPTYPVLYGAMPGPGLDCQPTKVRSCTSISLQLSWLLIRPKERTRQAHSRGMGSPELKDRNPHKTETVHSETIHVSNRSSHYHQKAGFLWTSAHEAHSVAPQGKLAHSRVLGKTNPHSQFPSQASTVVATRKERPSRPTSSSSVTKLKLGFYVPFNSQGHIGTSLRHFHLWDSNPQRGQPMIRWQNMLTTKPPSLLVIVSPTVPSNSST